ncbi:4-hydroxyphenylacetate 3-hydroxylase family protein [Terribacillus sp. 7520-G]|uniref:4-hydroxyphenylacetate 3-hydroxylase family protein n=1 Tax=Terribacillus sp. 7520-G TaxID=2025389 RepID=UPI000BA77FE6|nr:4-hydroxyphenylacetate 3-hydroxylase N-terminal domain-containing protein [Terribacillus sp. 7520-G]PAD37751.1 4-hydroxyphenylacetate 3-monooxygenase [Terribacillus sp. 7520-G]
MAVRTGEDYLAGIDAMGNKVLSGKTIINKPLSKHAAFRGVMCTQAGLYDLQHDAAYADKLTYTDRDSGEIYGLSFLKPETSSDLARRSGMIRCWAEKTHGMIGRSPDYMNTVLMALASSASLLEGKENCFPAHLRSYYEYVREHDLTMTHTFIDPQVNRGGFYFEQKDDPIAAKVVGRNAEGIIIHGAKLLATQGGITDELVVMSSAGFEQDRCYAFAIPSNTEGLTFVARESFTGGKSKADHPLSARYEEMDTIVLFDKVLIPWERIFYYDNVAVANSFKNESSFAPFGLHQVLIRRIAKLDFIIGLIQSLIEEINIAEYDHVREKAAKLFILSEVLQSLLQQAEAGAAPDRWGACCPDLKPLQVASNIFARKYMEIAPMIQQLGASGLMSIPPVQVFKSDKGMELNHYLQGATKPGKDRVKLFRVAWDFAMSSFGTRETLYEYFFFGDPVRLISQFYGSIDFRPYKEKVDDLLS